MPINITTATAIGLLTGKTNIPKSKDEMAVAAAVIAGNSIAGPVGGLVAEQVALKLFEMNDSEDGATMSTQIQQKVKSATDPSGFVIQAVNTSFSWLPMSQSIVASYAQDWTNGEGSNIMEEGALVSLKNAAAAAGADALAQSQFASTNIRDTMKIAADYKQKVLYKGPTFRSFSWPLVLQPKTKQEADEMYAWILDMKLRASPIEAGAHFKNPEYFALDFFYGGAKRKMFSMHDLACTNIEVNYTPNNIWSQHEDGSPTAIAITFSFMETVRTTRDNIKKFDL